MFELILIDTNGGRMTWLATYETLTQAQEEKIAIIEAKTLGDDEILRIVMAF